MLIHSVGYAYPWWHLCEDVSICSVQERWPTHKSNNSETTNTKETLERLKLERLLLAEVGGPSPFSFPPTTEPHLKVPRIII